MTKKQDRFFALPQAARFGNCSRHCPTSATAPGVALPPASVQLSCIHAVEGDVHGGTA